MKVETTITIEADLLARADRAAKGFRDRSEVFEKALKVYLPTLTQKRQKPKLTGEEEIEAINRYADEHREEILENLEYQIDL
jgi:metal-responsive CopG/Arc/MetJ family transcriptional regulator